MNNKPSLIVAAVLLGLAGWWMLLNRESDPAKSGPPESASADSGTYLQEFESALRRAESDLRKGDFKAAALGMNRAFPGFETHLHEHGFQEIRAGTTLKVWFEAEKTRLVAAIDETFPALIEQMKQGEASRRYVEDFLNHMPFPFIHETKRNYDRQRSEISKARSASATNWCFVSVNAVSGAGGDRYETIVRDGLQRRWNDGLGLKLVFDAPMNWDEKQAAAKVLSVKIEESFATYAFEGADQQRRGQGKVAEAVTVTVANQTVRKDASKLNWDALPAITVTNEAPEALRFQFENERQTADFSNVAERQQQGLAQALARALETVPAVAITHAGR